jgi:tetratricopeptide (TPR) repeat protein
LQTNNYFKAELDFKSVVSINPNSYLGFIGLADCCKLAYKYEMAIELYQRSLVLLEESKDLEKINTKEIYLKMGICFYFLEKYSDCQEMLSDLSLNKEMKTS